MANTIRIKRRTYSSGGSSGAPTELALGELAFNDNDRTLYIGAGSSGGNTVLAVAGEGLNYVTLNTNQTIDSSKTFLTGSTTTFNSGSTVDIAGTFKLGGSSVTSSASELNQLASKTLGDAIELNVGISNTNLLQAGSGIANSDFLKVSGSAIVGRDAGQVLSDIGAQPLNALLTDLSDIAATSTGANQFIVSTGIGAFALESGTTVRTSIGLGTSNSPEFTGLTLSGALSANGGIAVDTNKFTVADGTGNTDIAGTLEVDGNTVLNGGLDFGGTVGTAAAGDGDIVVIDGGAVKIKSNADVLTAIGGAPAAGSSSITTLGTITTGTWGATDIAVAHGGTGASTAAAARTNLGVDAAGTDNSTNVTLAGSYDYITISGQQITRHQIDLAADVTGTLPAAKVGVLPASKITTGEFNDNRIKASNVTQHQGSITSVGTLNGLTVSGNVDMQSSLDVQNTLDVKTGDLYISSGSLIGPSIFYIDPLPNDSPHGANSPDDGETNNSPAATGKVIIRGDLQVDGTTTTINSTEISITDKQMVLADNQTQYSGLSGSGLLLGSTSTAGQGLVEFQYVNAVADAEKRMELTGAGGSGTDIGLHISGGLYNTVVDGGTF